MKGVTSLPGIELSFQIRPTFALLLSKGVPIPVAQSLPKCHVEEVVVRLQCFRLDLIRLSAGIDYFTFFCYQADSQLVP
jgi:hypothetical protein